MTQTRLGASAIGLALSLSTVPAWGQAAVPLPQEEEVVQPGPPEPAPAESAPAEAADPAPSPQAMQSEPAPAVTPAGPPPPPRDAQPSTQPAEGEGPKMQFDSGAQQDPKQDGSKDSQYVSTIGPRQSPRRAFFLGFGGGLGRIQDDITGYLGFGFNVNAGYSITKDIAVALDAGGFFHSEENQDTLSLWSAALGPQFHLFDRLRITLEGGVYGLGGRGDGLWSPGGEGGLGFEIYQAPGGTTFAVEFRSQMTFPDGQLVFTTTGLAGVRWYGIGHKGS